MFVGRKYELSALEALYKETIGRLVVVYGRRRIGKSELITKFCKGVDRDKSHLYIEGLEGERTPAQIRNFINQLAVQTRQPHLVKTRFDHWNEVFQYLTENVFSQKKKWVLALDELQWIAVGQNKLINQIKVYWDQHWRSQGVLLILCGSVAHFMVRKVIRSKALYGRVDSELLIGPLNPFEISEMFKSRDRSEILKYQIVFGGVPKYYDLIKKTQSFDKNMNQLCFKSDGYFVEEVEKIFYSQFKEHQTYKKIAEILTKKPLSSEKIAKSLNLKSGGRLTELLNNLILSGFVRKLENLEKTSQKRTKFKLTDEFLRFYYSQMSPHLSRIKKNKDVDIYTLSVKPKISPWMGVAFENFCLNRDLQIAKILKISEQVAKSGSIFSKDEGFQIDLAFYRNDSVITVCEIKYYSQPVGVEVIKEIESKLRKFQTPKGYSIEKVLIAPNGVESSVEKLEYFTQIITLDDFFKD